MYLISVYDPQYDVQILESRELKSIAQINEFLIKYTGMNRAECDEFFLTLEVDGIAERTHGRNAQGFFDITVMKDSSYREPLIDAVRRITLENAK